MLEIIIQFLLLGAIAGVLAGMLGIGGGLIIVPALAIILPGMGIGLDVLMHMAIGTSLATIVVTSLMSTWSHHQYGAINWLAFRRLAPGIMLGVIVGAVIADYLSGNYLRNIFGIFEILVAAQMASGFRPSPHRKLPGMTGMSITGVIIGVVSAIVGIGGGTMTVPFLSWCNIVIRNAVATSAACGLPIAVTGMVSYLVTGLDAEHLPSWSTGYIYWPAFAGIVSATLVFTPLGARLAHTLPIDVLKRIFALVLLCLGIYMLFG